MSQCLPLIYTSVTGIKCFHISHYKKKIYNAHLTASLKGKVYIAPWILRLNNNKGHMLYHISKLTLYTLLEQKLCALQIIHVIKSDVFPVRKWRDHQDAHHKYAHTYICIYASVYPETNIWPACKSDINWNEFFA